jgi:hypothetical protein
MRVLIQLLASEVRLDSMPTFYWKHFLYLNSLCTKKT